MHEAFTIKERNVGGKNEKIEERLFLHSVDVSSNSKNENANPQKRKRLSRTGMGRWGGEGEGGGPYVLTLIEGEPLLLNHPYIKVAIFRK